MLLKPKTDALCLVWAQHHTGEGRAQNRVRLCTTEFLSDDTFRCHFLPDRLRYRWGFVAEMHHDVPA